MDYFTPETDPLIDFSKVDPTSLGMLTMARGLADIPFFITSTYRTPEHSVEVGGTMHDAHTETPCTAFDILCSGSRDRFLIVKACLAAGFVRIGFNEHHVHVDNSKTHDQNVMWIEP